MSFNQSGQIVSGGQFNIGVPDTPRNTMDAALVAIQSLKLLFFNYTNEDIVILRKDRQFDRIWREQISAEDDTYVAMWVRFPDMQIQTQRIIIEYAQKKYGVEASRKVAAS